MALNAETKISSDSECQTKISGVSERQNEDVMALNAKMKMWLWKSNWRPMMALNAKTRNVTLNVKLGSNDDDSERQTENTMMALNAKTEKWWWL